MPLITLSSDFEKQSYGCGAMEGVIYEVNPEARVIHQMHGIERFSLLQGARTMETLVTMPVGYHVCVVDPGVGTKRRGIAIQVARGDILVGPDNGVLIPATRILGGIIKTHELTNPRYQRKPVSPIFHGRDLFAMAAAYLSKGVPLSDFGQQIPEKELTQAPYKDAFIKGNRIEAIVIHINRFGTLFLNILQKTWDQFDLPLGGKILIRSGKKSLRMTHVQTFGDVPAGSACIIKDDYTRVEAAINQGSFVKKFPVRLGDTVTLQKIL
ncbi:MAG: SAM-dependent chlorinase/fluorinase [Deltaproteobacteria bacterium]|nr:SAM-dependent chlorinase/fluorinase [Deltaproteobacteria bacterium]